MSLGLNGSVLMSTLLNVLWAGLKIREIEGLKLSPLWPEILNIGIYPHGCLQLNPEHTVTSKQLEPRGLEVQSFACARTRCD